MALIKREVKREKVTGDHQGADEDVTTKEHYGKDVFSTSTKKNVIKPYHAIQPLPKQSDSLEGQLNADTRSDYNDPDKMPRTEHHQGRNDEHIKHGDKLGSRILPPGKNSLSPGDVE